MQRMETKELLNCNGGFISIALNFFSGAFSLIRAITGLISKLR